MAGAVLTWFKSHLPTRESIAGNRWLRPFAHLFLRPDLWHLNRRSVPRAVALGLFVAPIVPVAHTVVAALFAVPARANVVIAATATWLINPLTMPPFYYAAYKIGAAILRIDGMSPLPVTHEATHRATEWLTWLSAKSGPTALGTLVLATILASLGYLISSLFWRLEVGRRWRARRGK